MRAQYIFFLILGIDAAILFSQTSQLSISYQEALLLYGGFSFLGELVKISLSVFGHNEFGLRFVMISLHIMSVVLIYLISKKYLPSQRNRLWLLLMFVLLPGVVSSAVIVNSAGLVIFGLLLYVYLSDKTPQALLNALLLVYALIDVGFVYLFLALAIYYLFQKRSAHFIYNIGLVVISSYLYGVVISGYPSGYFLDTIGVYSAVFTPIIFVYIFYTLYRRYLTDNIDLLWYIAATGLLFSLLLSFRQNVPIEHFAPYLILALPLAAQTFAHSYTIRLKEHRKGYRSAFIIAFIFLTLNTLVVFFNKELYPFIEKPKKHFVYDMHIAKELSNQLKHRGIKCLETSYKMQLRLKHYGIQKCQDILLQELSLRTKEPADVTISYKKRIIYKASVTKINK